MKKKDLPILLAYSVPWAFLMLYGDMAYGWAWHYAAIFVCVAVLAWRGVKSGGVLLAGNGLSLGTSLLCVYLLDFAAQNHYFKPFGAFGWTIGLALPSMLVQWLVWKREWQVLGLLTAVVGTLLGAAFSLQFGM